MAGTSQVSLLGFLGYQEETSTFAQAVSTHDKVLQVRDATLDTSGILQEMVPRGGVYGRPNQGDFHIPGPHQGATLTFTMDLYGHHTATTAGALTQTPLARLFGHAVGNADADAVGAQLDGTSDFDTLDSSGATLTVGDIVRVGTLGDGRAEGQGTVLVSSSNPYGTGVDLPAAPTDGTDNIYAMQMIYPEDTTTNAHLTSDGSSNNNTLRFVVATGAQQWVLRGCACTSFKINGLNTGEVPSVTFTFAAAWWTDIDVTFPSAIAAADGAPGVCAGGSFYYNTTGTGTRVTDSIRNFDLTVNHEMFPVLGQGGANPNQVIVGWVRGKSMPTITFDVEAQDATTSPTWSNIWNTDPNSLSFREFLYTAIPHDQRGVALYLPKCRPVGQRPTQQDLEGLSYVTVQFEGVEGPTTTNAKTRSPWRLGLG